MPQTARPANPAPSSTISSKHSHRHLLDLGAAVNIHELGQKEFNALLFQMRTCSRFSPYPMPAFFDCDDLIHDLIPSLCCKW
jgi:hypothetical protein